jgi:lipid-A-disaccharide synthase
MSRGLRLVLVAGEASGDLHGAALVRALRARRPDLEVAGIGGAELRRAGMRTVVDASHVATMGFSEAFGSLGRLVSAYRAVVALLDRERPDLVVLIDYPEFNLMVARQAKRRGIPVFYFIGPQVWAWRRGRVRKIRRRVDRMGLVFPFEPALYNDGREIAAFIGHPLLDAARATRPRAETRRRYGLDPERPLLALLPGSRQKEIGYLLEPMRAAAEILAGERWQAALALAPGLAEEEVAALGSGSAAIALVRADTYNLLAAADAAIVASGTATLESALLGCPMVIVYRMARLTYWLARLLVRVKWIGMPNILLDRAVFPELIQDEVRGETLAAAVRSLGARREELAGALAEVRARLGEPGAAERAADMALELVA